MSTMMLFFGFIVSTQSFKRGKKYFSVFSVWLFEALGYYPRVRESCGCAGHTLHRLIRATPNEVSLQPSQ